MSETKEISAIKTGFKSSKWNHLGVKKSVTQHLSDHLPVTALPSRVAALMGAVKLFLPRFL